MGDDLEIDMELVPIIFPIEEYVKTCENNNYIGDYQLLETAKLIFHQLQAIQKN